MNGAIRAPQVRCIDPDGEQLGVLDTREAISKAEDFGLDLVEVQPNVDPPVCKILDYGKYKYEAQKRANEARKKQKIIEVKEIKRLTPHDNNQELWDKVLGKEVVSNEKDFREKVSAELHSQFDRDAEHVFRRRFVVDLIEHMKIEMPDAFLKRWIQMNNEQPLTEEQMEKEYPNYAESMRWQLLQQAVMKESDMRVSAEELEEEAKRVIGAQYAQYGMPLEGEMLDNFAKNALSNDEERRRIADIIIERKVVDELKPKVTIKDKSVSFDDFAKLAAEVR